jgi:A/G-specific adenine glycosylase
MLQQTQVDTVIPYYQRFLRRFPTVKRLAAARLEDVLKTWENLGYYSRARHLHEAARIVSGELRGKLPGIREELIRLPGVGAYTAGAVLSIAFGQRYPAVDGNVRRVLSRIYAIRKPLKGPGVVSDLEEKAAMLLPWKDPGRFNQALMDLGAMVCTPKRPQCDPCPVRDLCAAFKAGLQDDIPAGKRRPPVPLKQLAAAVLKDRAARMLVVRRPPKGLLAGLWGFPAGEILPGEAPEEGVRRLVLEALGVRMEIVRPLGRIKHAYSHFRIVVQAFECALKSKRTVSPRGHEWRWATRAELEVLALSKADRKVLQLWGVDDSGSGY